MGTSAVLVSWNSLELLPACLAALRRQTVPLDEIVAVDNGSVDGSAEWLGAQPDVVLVRNPDNLGFAAANNQGIRASSCEHVLLINTDVDLADDYLALTTAHLANATVGSVTGKLMRPPPGAILDSTGHAVYGVGWAENRGEEMPDSGFDVPGEVFGVCAAAAVYRRAALDAAAVDGQYFDETYFSYIEDVDLDWRLRWLGWRAWYEPRAVAVHHRSASGARRSARIMRHILKNRLLTVIKNYDRRSLALRGPGVLAFTLVKLVDFGRAHPTSALGLVDVVRLLPQALHKRRLVAAMRVASAEEVTRWLLPFPWARRVRRRLRHSEVLRGR